MHIGRHIRHVREQLGESQVQFSVRLGVGLSTLQRWEDGKTFPTLYRHIETLSREGVPRDELVARATQEVAS
jgi:transcriptional regulator with XRE-family HTH domain